MVKSQTVRSINKLVASISSLMQCFAAIAGSIREKQKWILQCPPLMDILVKYVFELRRTTGGKKFYQHTVTLSAFYYKIIYTNIHR